MLPNGYCSVLILAGFDQNSSPVVIKIFIYSFEPAAICNFLFSFILNFSLTSLVVLIRFWLSFPVLLECKLM